MMGVHPREWRHQQRHPALRLVLLGLLAWLQSLGCWAGAPREFPLVSYHSFPPFMVDAREAGLTRDLVELLNREAAGQYRFVPVHLPRGRVDKLLNEPGWAGVTLWMSPAFVGDEARERYVWSAPLFNETELVASRASERFEYMGPASLQGRILGGVLYHRYADVEPLIAERRLRREDAPHQEANLQKLIKGRVDTVFISRSTLNWLQAHTPALTEGLHLSAQPRNSYGRHLMMTRHLPADVRESVLGVLQRLPRTEAWTTLVQRYGLPQ